MYVYLHTHTHTNTHTHTHTHTHTQYIDEDTEEESMVFKLIKYILVDIVLRSSTLFPIHDNPERWGNLAQANRIMKVVKALW